MDGESEIAGLDRRDWWAVGLLLLLAGVIHIWLITHTEVAARDSIGMDDALFSAEAPPGSRAASGEAAVFGGFPDGTTDLPGGVPATAVGVVDGRAGCGDQAAGLLRGLAVALGAFGVGPVQRQAGEELGRHAPAATGAVEPA